MASLKQLVEGPHMRIVTSADQGRDVEGAPQMAIAVTTDAGLFAHRAARDLVYRIEAAMGDPLTHGHLRVEPCQLAPQRVWSSVSVAMCRLSVRNSSPQRLGRCHGTNSILRLYSDSA